MYKWRYIKDRMFVLVVITASLIAVAPIFHIIYVVIANGLAAFMREGASILTEIPPSPLSKAGGGIAPAIVGTALMVLSSLPISVTISFFAALLASEFPSSRLSKIAAAFVRSFASIPTIVVSMVVYTVVVVPMRGFSALAGAISLAIITLPYAYTSFVTALNSVPRSYREAAISLGMTRWKAVIKVVIPIAWRGVITAVLVSMARSMGETAALLFTAGRYRAGINYSLLEPTDALPLLIFDFILTPFPRYHELAWAASFLLMVSYLVIFLGVKLAVRGVRL